MKRLHTNQICTITELREPQKVLDAAGCIGYLVPEEATLQQEPRYATMDEVMAAVEATHAQAQPVLDYLKDK